MKFAGGFGEAEEIDALIWWSRGTCLRRVGLLIPYWRDSALFVVFRSRYSRFGIHIARTYTQGSAARRRQIDRILTRHRARC